MVIFNIFFGHALNYRNFKEKITTINFLSLPDNEKEFFIKEIQVIINLDSYLEHVFFRYFIFSDNFASRKKFIQYIQTDQKEYWKKVKKYFLIQYILYLLYILF